MTFLAYLFFFTLAVIISTLIMQSIMAQFGRKHAKKSLNAFAVYISETTKLSDDLK